MSAGDLTLQDARAALKSVEADAEALEMFSTEYAGVRELPTVGDRRRRLRAGLADSVATVSLILNEEGVLEWREGTFAAAAPSDRRLRRGLTPSTEGELVEAYQCEKLEPNEINEFLTKLDRRLNERRGLWRMELRGGKPVALDGTWRPKGSKRRLLLVHGTFSKSSAFFAGIARAPNGDDFVKRIFAHYDEVLVHEHPTLSVSPILNAFDLFAWMKDAAGPLDIVAHSGGGLVTRWFLEGFGDAAAGKGPYRAVLVGAPLGGTSLASPARLRDSLSLLTNIGTALKAAGAASVLYVPFLTAPLALLRIATSVVSVVRKTPILDAAVSMVPGLAAQSRVLMNHELDRLRSFELSTPPTYFVVQSNFESEDPGWRFWRWFRGDNLKDAVTNRIFRQENDLVVDTRSMSEFVVPPVPIPAKRQYDFGTSDTVHHLNYFEQRETLDFILGSFGVK